MTASNTRFAIIGAGGLGGPIAYALAAAGAKQLLLCDDDVVELSNLQRQVQFSTTDIGNNKVFALADELTRRGYPRGRLRLMNEPFEPNSADNVLNEADVVIDGSDDFPTKFLVNDRCVEANVPFVVSAAIRYGGQVMAVRPGVTACYRCLFETPPPNHDSLSCNDAGVLGATVGIIGGIAAAAAIALGTGDDANASAGTLLVFDDLRDSTTPRRVAFHPREGCHACDARTARTPMKEAL